MNTRKGYVVMIQGGDAAIAGAIADGMRRAAEGRGTTSSVTAAPCHLPGAYRPGLAENSAQCCFPGAAAPLKGKALTVEQVEIVEAEIDRQRIQRALLRVAVGNTNTAEDYRDMMTKARGDYGTDARKAGPLRAIGERLMQVYALMVLAASAAYRAQDAVLGRR